MKKLIALFAVSALLIGCAITGNGTPAPDQDVKYRFTGRIIGLFILDKKPELVPAVKQFCTLIAEKPDLGKINLVDMALSYLEKEYPEYPAMKGLIQDILIVCGVPDWLNADIRVDAIVDMAKDMKGVSDLAHKFDMVAEGLCESVGA